ncbi:MAG TPA: SPFH domain-containing protein [Bacillota bacterium]|nr:SPFH domain-containing protein [Bacillota bacterium]
MTDNQVFRMNGFLALILSLLSLLVGAYLIVNENITAILFFIIGVSLLSGLTIIQPNQAIVVMFFGKYLGVIKESGFSCTVPFSYKKKISLRVQNFESGKLKVNDIDGNPIEIAANVVYRVVDPKKAVFDVENYQEFIKIQSETGLRHVASMYPYDNHDPSQEISLRGNSDDVARELQEDLQRRLDLSGVEIMEARLMHLAYSPEIAPAMLQRQQAKAILASRQIIVDGAVGMVKLAIDQLEKDGTVHLDEERKAAMVNNLMVSIVSERSAQPIINAGTVY